jgi:acetoin utilization deacetylase AcuC-like enzyme
MLQEQGLVARCSRIPVRAATREELLAVHTFEHIEAVMELPSKSEEELEDEANRYNSIYMSQGTAMAAVLAAGGVTEVTRRVCKGEVKSAVAVVRPPGHHCESHEAMGFCLFGNVAIAAKQALTEWGVQRVLVLDWDVHHGNGTQNMFYNDDSVLLISLHRGNGFYPGGEALSYTAVGEEEGEGYSLNIPWPRGGVGDAEYLRAFDRIVMPVAEEFAPELVLISAGFDAARGDPLGGCDLTPQGYFTMTRRLQGLAGGRVVVALEGGYNLSSISNSMAACVKALLGDEAGELQVPLELMADPEAVCDRGIDSMLTQIQGHFSQYWPILAVRQLAEDIAAAAVDEACLAVTGETAESLLFGDVLSPEEVEWEQMDDFSSLSGDEPDDSMGGDSTFFDSVSPQRFVEPSSEPW